MNLASMSVREASSRFNFYYSTVFREESQLRNQSLQLGIREKRGHFHAFRIKNDALADMNTEGQGGEKS
jgi:hypothetical protein